MIVTKIINNNIDDVKIAEKNFTFFLLELKILKLKEFYLTYDSSGIFTILIFFKVH